MSLRNVIEELKHDLERCKQRLKQPSLAIILLVPGFQAVASYRFRRWLNTRSRRRNLFWMLISMVEAVLARFVEIITGIYIDPDATIGPGLYIHHFSCIVIGQCVVLGRNCELHQGVTLGFGGRGESSGYPVIGDRAFIGAGAKVIGPIRIGRDVAIGANAVVTKDLPDRAIAVGIPARIISREGSFDFINYPDRDLDRDRALSLALTQAAPPDHHLAGPESSTRPGCREAEAAFVTMDALAHEALIVHAGVLDDYARAEIVAGQAQDDYRILD